MSTDNALPCQILIKSSLSGRISYVKAREFAIFDFVLLYLRAHQWSCSFNEGWQESFKVGQKHCLGIIPNYWIKCTFTSVSQALWMAKITTVSLNTIICNTIINLLNHIETDRVQYWSFLLKWLNKAYGQHLQQKYKDTSQHKDFFLLIYSTVL